MQNKAQPQTITLLMYKKKTSYRYTKNTPTNILKIHQQIFKKIHQQKYTPIKYTQ